MTDLYKLVVATGLCLCSAVAAAAGDLPTNPSRDCDPIGRPRPGCLPQSGRTTPSVSQDQPTRTLTDDEIQKDKQRQKERAERAAKIPLLYPSVEEIASETKRLKEFSRITLKGNGKTFVSGADGSKSEIFLDDETYPVRTLTLTCQPQNAAAIGQPRYDSRGPGLYPLELVTFQPGKCVLRNKDFLAAILIPDLLPESRPLEGRYSGGGVLDWV